MYKYTTDEMAEKIKAMNDEQATDFIMGDTKDPVTEKDMQRIFVRTLMVNEVRTTKGKDTSDRTHRPT